MHFSRFCYCWPRDRFNPQIKSNAVRALGNLSRVIPFVNPLEQGKCAFSSPLTSKMGIFSWKCSLTQKDTNCSSNSTGCFHLLENIVQAFLSCITTGNVKVSVSMLLPIFTIYSLSPSHFAPFSILICPTDLHHFLFWQWCHSPFNLIHKLILSLHLNHLFLTSNCFLSHSPTQSFSGKFTHFVLGAQREGQRE